MRKYNKRNDKKEKWMTNKLLNQINLKNDIYVEWKSQSTSIDIYNSRKINFKTFERIVNRHYPKKFYHDTFNSYKNNIKKTLTTINDTLGRDRNQNKLPTYIVDNEKKMTNPEKIANTFNNYFANIGTNLASTISNDQTETYTQYLQTPSAISCIIRHITEDENITIVDKMENK